MTAYPEQHKILNKLDFSPQRGLAVIYCDTAWTVIGAQGLTSGAYTEQSKYCYTDIILNFHFISNKLKY